MTQREKEKPLLEEGKVVEFKPAYMIMKRVNEKITGFKWLRL